MVGQPHRVPKARHLEQQVRCDRRGLAAECDQRILLFASSESESLLPFRLPLRRTVSTSHLNAICRRVPSHLIRLLAAPLPTRSHIPSTRTAAAQTCLNKPSENGKCRRRPHEPEQVVTNRRRDVELTDRGDDVAEDDEHDGSNHRSNGTEQCVNKGEDGDGECPPPGDYGDGHEEYEDKRETGRGKEEAEHDTGDDFDEVEDIIDVRGEVDC